MYLNVCLHLKGIMTIIRSKPCFALSILHIHVLITDEHAYALYTGNRII